MLLLLLLFLLFFFINRRRKSFFEICLKMTILLIISPSDTEKERAFSNHTTEKSLNLIEISTFRNWIFKEHAVSERGKRTNLWRHWKFPSSKTFNTHACCGQTKHSLIVFQFSDGTSMSKEREKLFVVYKQTMGEQHLCY